MNQYFLSIGSNIEPEKYILKCLVALAQKFDLLKVSSLYETAPVGMSNAPKFWNAAAQIKTPLSKEETLKALREIEASLGRVRDPKNKFAPRTIDLDLLPQQDMNQAFILIPLAEIAAKEIDPGTKKNWKQLAGELKADLKTCRKVKSKIYKKAAYFA